MVLHKPVLSGTPWRLILYHHDNNENKFRAETFVHQQMKYSESNCRRQSVRRVSVSSYGELLRLSGIAAAVSLSNICVYYYYYYE